METPTSTANITLPAKPLTIDQLVVINSTSDITPINGKLAEQVGPGIPVVPPTNDDRVKRCTNCGEEKTLTKFSAEKNGRFGVKSICKPCVNKRSQDHKLAKRNRSIDEISKKRNDMHPNGKKYCSLCEEEKTFSEFCEVKASNDGLNSYCKPCANRKIMESRRDLYNRSDEELITDIYDHHGDVTATTKFCSGCKKTMQLSEFNVDREVKNGIESRCVSCKREEEREYRNKKREQIAEFKTGKSCEHCGNDDIRCLEFAHYHREEKARTRDGKPIVMAHLSLSRMIEEVEKTRFLCRNCHTEETYMETHDHHNDYRGAPIKLLLYKLVNEEKLNRSHCVDCGLKVENDNYHIFDFDHLSAYEKILNISMMVCKSYSSQDIIDEMKKCELRCRNCHHLKTLERGQYGGKIGIRQNVLSFIDKHAGTH